MMRTAVLIDLRVRLRSMVGVVAFLLLLLLLALAITICFRLLGQQVAPAVNYGGYGLSGFGRTPTTTSVSSDLRPALSTLTSSSRGIVALVILASVLALAGGLLSTLVGASGIAGEYERETLDLALSTQMGPGGLTASKLLATFLYALLLTLVVLPAFAFLLIFSHVPVANVAVAAAIVAGNLLCGSAIGIVCSATLHSTLAAFLSAAALSMLLFGGGSGAYLLLLQMSGNPPLLAQVLLVPSPVAALLSSATSQLQGSDTLLLPALLHASPEHPVHLIGPWQMPLPFWTLTLTLDIALTALCLALSRRSLSRSLVA